MLPGRPPHSSPADALAYPAFQQTCSIDSHRSLTRGTWHILHGPWFQRLSAASVPVTGSLCAYGPSRPALFGLPHIGCPWQPNAVHYDVVAFECPPIPSASMSVTLLSCCRTRYRGGPASTKRGGGIVAGPHERYDLTDANLERYDPARQTKIVTGMIVGPPLKITMGSQSFLQCLSRGACVRSWTYFVGSGPYREDSDFLVRHWRVKKAVKSILHGTCGLGRCVRIIDSGE